MRTHTLGIALAGAITGLPLGVNAAGCGTACQQAIDVLQNPRPYDLLVRHTHTETGHSAVYLTWTAKQDPARPPVQFEGILHATLQQPVLQRVWLPDPANGCAATLDIVDLGVPERTAYQVPARNILCDAPVPAQGAS